MTSAHDGARKTRAQGTRLEALLLDRDGTLVEDGPAHADPSRVRLAPRAAEALALARGAGLFLGVVTNQSGLARGLLSWEQLDEMHSRIDELLIAAGVGPVDGWFVCPHGPDDGCLCRKPRPGLVHDACATLGVSPDAVVVIGDVETDILAAAAAGARAVMVPTPVTLPEEIARAPAVARDLVEAVTDVLADEEAPT